MATYQYNAVSISNKSKLQGTITAETERQARELLRQQELYPTLVKQISKNDKSVSETKLKQVKKHSAMELWLAEKLSSVGSQEIVAFTQNTEIMVRAGIPITEALLYMESYMENPKFKRMLNTIRTDILSGYSFSRALSKHPRQYSDIYVGIVQAGEASGELEVVLKRLGDMLVAQAKMKKKIVAAMIYPCMVIAICGLVLLVMFYFVLPTFADMYAKMGVELPLITKIMLGISAFLRSFWYIAIAMGVGGTFGFKKLVQTTFGKELVDKIMLKVPVVSPLIYAVASANFLSTLHISFSAGLPITDCILMACQTVTHVVLRAAFDMVNIKIQGGTRLASALSEANILPGMVLIMISSGEEAGNLEEMLVHSIDYLEDIVNQRIEILMSMMEPCLLVILGAIVLCMALSIYMPLFGMYEHIH